MNIGLISDTHIPEAMPELPVQIRQVFVGTELILHAGDLHCLAVLDWLEEIAPVLAVRGNRPSRDRRQIRTGGQRRAASRQAFLDGPRTAVISSRIAPRARTLPRLTRSTRSRSRSGIARIGRPWRTISSPRCASRNACDAYLTS